MKYRVCTLDGHVLDDCPSIRQARSDANHRARYMGECMRIDRWNEHAGWSEVERVAGDAR